jgi:hypothetical protein
VKVYNGLTPATLDAIAAAAERRGLPVVGHVPVWVSFEAARVADVQHLSGVAAPGAPLWEWPNPSFDDFVSPWVAGWRRTDPARLDAIVRTSLEKGMRHTPTLVVWSRTARLFDEPGMLEDPAAQLLPRLYREVVWSPTRFDPRSAKALGEVLPRMTEAVRRLHEAGVPIHAGTDVMNPFVVPGASLHEEIRNLAAAGFTAEEALASATIVPGGFLDPAMRGGVQVGAPADLAIFRRDPTRDLADLATLEAVVADGRLYPRSALDGTLARSKAEFDGPLADRVGMLLARLAMRWVRSQ